MPGKNNNTRPKPISRARTSPPKTLLKPLAKIVEQRTEVISSSDTERSPRDGGDSIRNGSLGNPGSPAAKFTFDAAENENEENEDDEKATHGLGISGSTSNSGPSSRDLSPTRRTRSQPPALTRLERSHSPFLIPSNAFAPPFYNRPPTPLPPSPSLTSLLRPSFTSRPNSPDESENDTANDTEALVAKSARHATTVPRASPKVPTYEYYGFVLYLMSSLAFLIYLLWSYLPAPFLHQMGIHYYPDRWWSLAIPAFLMVTIVYIYVALACYNTEVLTLPINSIENLVDESANIAVLDDSGRIKNVGRRESDRVEKEGRVDYLSAWSVSTDAVMDVPIAGVCEILYGGDEEREGEKEDIDGT